MGGKLFDTKRLPAEEYFHVCSFIKPKLLNLFNKVELVRAYFSKIEHGDADFLCSEQKDTFTNIRDQIVNEFNPARIHCNSNIISFELFSFQIDVVITKSKYFETSKFYYSDSPSGNLNGKLLHRLSGSLGFDGLYYTLRDNENTYKLGTISISTNPQKICEFLGLDFQQKVNGFDKETDIFEWVIASKYFDARIFSFENMNHRARIRDRKRSDYRRFVKYIESKYKNKIYNWPLYKEEGLVIINDYFPEARLLEQIQELKDKRTKIKNLSQKFNGSLVMQWTNLSGKDLGAALSNYKNSKLDWMQFLEQTSESDIKEDFIKFNESINFRP